MNKLIEKMQVYCEGVRKQNDIMLDVVKQFVVLNGGYIGTDRNDCDSIWATYYNEQMETFMEYYVEAIKVENGNVLLKLSGLYNHDDGWEELNSGNFMLNATLYFLCEAISQYV